MYAEGEQSVAEGTHAYAESLRRSGRRDAKLLFDHRQAADHWNLDKRAERIEALQEAYGPAAAWMDLDAIADYWDDPQASEAEFRRFWLNQPVPLEERPPLVFPRWPDRISDVQPDPETLGIAADIEHRWLSLGAFGSGHVGASLRVRAETGRDHFVSEVSRIAKSRRLRVVVQSPGPASTLVDALKASGVKVIEAKFDDFVQACADMADAVETGLVTHGNYPELNDAIDAASWATRNDRRVISRKSGDVSMLESVILARWAAVSKPTMKPIAIWG